MPGIVRTDYSSIFKDILWIFRDTDAYSTTLTGAQLKGKVKAYPNFFFENRKKCFAFRKKAVIVFIFELKFPFKM